MIRRPRRSTQGRSSAASDVYKRQAWAAANVLKIDQYPGYKAGDRQATTVRILRGQTALYAQFLCDDKHIFAKETSLHGPVLSLIHISEPTRPY